MKSTAGLLTSDEAGRPSRVSSPLWAASVVTISLLLLFGPTGANAAPYPPPQGTELPPLSLFELARKSDLAVLARPLKARDQVRVLRVLSGQSNSKTLAVANFTRLWRGLQIPDAEKQKGQNANDFQAAVLFLRHDGDRWWIVESIPRARAANGCIWIQGDTVMWYPRRVWNDGRRLTPRYPANGGGRRGSRDSMTSGTLFAEIRQWDQDLTRLREIDRMEDPMAQVRALRAYVSPSNQPPHSRPAIDLARRAHSDAYRQTALYEPPEKPAPPTRPTWELIRGGPSDPAAVELAALESKQAADRTRALRNLRTMAILEAVPAAEKGLGDPDVNVRQAAADLLMDFADPTTSEPLLAAFRQTKDRRDPVRRSLAYALISCQAPEAVGETILALQEPDEPYRREIAGALYWLSGRNYDKKAENLQYSAAYWTEWFAKRFGQPLQLKPWDFARLESLIKRDANYLQYLPSSELKLIPDETVSKILEECAKPGAPRRNYWCQIIIRAWGAGTLSQDQVKAALETFGQASVSAREAYPMSTMATLSVGSQWPSGVQLPRSVKFSAKSQAIIDGNPVGRAYPLRYPGIYLSPPLRPGDYGPGEHSLVVQTEYSIQSAQGAMKHNVQSEEKKFAVVLPGAEYGLQRTSTPELDKQVEAAFQFALASEAELTGRPEDDGTTNPPPPKPINRQGISEGKYLEIYGRNTWKLAEALPVDLALTIEYEFIDEASVVPGGQIYVPKGDTQAGTLDAFAYGRNITSLTEPGLHRFRVHFTPDRDTALSHVTSQAYWDGYILTSPEMTYRLVITEPKKK